MRTRLITDVTATYRQAGKVNQPAKRYAQLVGEVEALKRELRDRIKCDADRQAAQAEYERVLQFFVEAGSALASDVVACSPRVEVHWLASLGQECRRAKVVIPDTWTTPRIFAKGDEQLGHACCDVERVQQDIEWVAKNPQTLLVLLGDGIDVATPTSPGSIRENPQAPVAQVNSYIELHKPVADRIIGLVGGNHERRFDKALGEPGAGVALLARGLSALADRKIPYSGGILLLDVHWRGHVWTFTLFHGAGAAQTAGAKIQRMQRNLLLTDSLITLSAHLHDEAKTSRRFVRRQADGTVRVVKQTALQCGTYLKYLGSYGEVKGMAPVGPDMILIELCPDGRYIDRFKGDGDL